MKEADNALRVAIVTGVSGIQRGIGTGIAEALAEDGVSLMLADVSESVAQIADTIRAQYPGISIRTFVGDLSLRDTATSLVNEAIAAFGQVDILVNNAGGGVIRPFLDHDEESINQTISRNLLTTIWCTHAILPRMVSRNHGRVVNIGADSLRTGIPMHAGYNAAKGGVVGLQVGLAREFAEYDITFNTVSPCIVETERVRNMPESRRKPFVDVIPKGRGAEIEDVASMVRLLASRASSFITGQDISVNGGSAMP